MDFKFYGWIWRWNLENKRPRIGRWLGVNRNVDQALSSYVLKANGKIVTSTTVQNVTVEDALSPSAKNLMTQHDDYINSYLNRNTTIASIDDKVDAARILDAPAEEFEFETDDQPEEDSHD